MIRLSSLGFNNHVGCEIRELDIQLLKIDFNLFNVITYITSKEKIFDFQIAFSRKCFKVVNPPKGQASGKLRITNCYLILILLVNYANLPSIILYQRSYIEIILLVIFSTENSFSILSLPAFPIVSRNSLSSIN